MFQFTIIKDSLRWKHAVENFQHLDVYYSYEYGNSFAKVEHGELYGIYGEKGNTKLFYSFIKRRISLLGWENYYDIVTPYGYGGPYIEGNDESILLDFDGVFERFCQENNILTETIRFHPFVQNVEYTKRRMDVQFIRPTTAVDLTKPLEEIREEYTVMNKRNIKKAKREGLHCYVAKPTKENIHTFMQLYEETMNRNHASSFYYFQKDFFEEQMKATALSTSYLLFTEYKGNVIAAVLVMIGKKYAHYHLGASMTSSLYLKPNNLLFDYMISFCKEKGATLLHLGGGYTGDDGLFRFKQSFTNHNRYDYFLGKKVYNEVLYEEITRSLTETYIISENYFPIYRGIVGKKRSQVEVRI